MAQDPVKNKLFGADLVHADSVGCKPKMHVLLKNRIVDCEKQRTRGGKIANT